MGLQYCNVTNPAAVNSCSTSCYGTWSNVSGNCAMPTGVNTSNVNGLGTIAYSTNTMNWFSARTWCLSQGKRLIDSDTAKNNYSKLKAVIGGYTVWTNTAYGGGSGNFRCRSNYVNLDTGSVSSNTSCTIHNYPNKALCL